MRLSDTTYPHHPAVAQAVLEERCAVEGEVSALMAQLASADQDKIRQIISRLQMLKSKAAPGSTASRRSYRVVADALAQAQLQLIDTMYDDWKDKPQFSFNTMFEVHVYASMGAQAQQFYNAIDQTASYTITPVVQNGQMLVTEQKQIEGKQLRRLFSVVKYHAMSEKDKKDILSKTFGTEAVEDDKPKDATALKAEKEDLQHLHQALRDMEAYKAYILLSQSGGNLQGAMVRVAANHAVFTKAHSKVDEVIRVYTELMANPNDPVARAALKYTRFQLRELLRDEVVNKVLLESVEQPPAISATLGAAFAGPGLPGPLAGNRMPLMN
jgi:hypothetical protein